MKFNTFLYRLHEINYVLCLTKKNKFTRTLNAFHVFLFILLLFQTLDLCNSKTTNWRRQTMLKVITQRPKLARHLCNCSWCFVYAIIWTLYSWFEPTAQTEIPFRIYRRQCPFIHKLSLRMVTLFTINLLNFLIWM